MRHQSANLSGLTLQHFVRWTQGMSEENFPFIVGGDAPTTAGNMSRVSGGDAGELFPRMVHEKNAPMTVEEEDRLGTPLEAGPPAEGVHGVRT